MDIIWLLYLADLSTCFTGLFGTLGVGILISTMIIFLVLNDNCGDDWVKPNYSWMTAGLFFLGLACALPSKSTIYATAAVRVSQQVVQNSDVQDVKSEALKAIKAWLKKQSE